MNRTALKGTMIDQSRRVPVRLRIDENAQTHYHNAIVANCNLKKFG